MADRVIVIVQARLTSSRLPRKVLLPLVGRPLLSHVLTRVSAIRGVDGVCLAIPEAAQHDELAQLAATHENVIVVRGSESNVLSRFVEAIKQTRANLVIRVTSDCPFIDHQLCEGMLKLQQATGYRYVRNSFESGLPQGLDVEVVGSSALLEAFNGEPDEYECEHVTPFIWRRHVRFPALLVDHRPNLRHWRLTMDTPADYAFAQAVYDRLYGTDPLFGFSAIKALIDSEPELAQINALERQKSYDGRPDEMRSTTA